MNKVKTQHEADDSLDCLFHFFNLGDQQLISINHFLIRCRRSDTIEKSANLERTGGRGWTVDEIPAFFELDLHDYAITERISTLTESTPYPVVSAYPPPPPLVALEQYPRITFSPIFTRSIPHLFVNKIIFTLRALPSTTILRFVVVIFCADGHADKWTDW